MNPAVICVFAFLATCSAVTHYGSNVGYTLGSSELNGGIQYQYPTYYASQGMSGMMSGMSGLSNYSPLQYTYGSVQPYHQGYTYGQQGYGYMSPVNQRYTYGTVQPVHQDYTVGSVRPLSTISSLNQRTYDAVIPSGEQREYYTLGGHQGQRPYFSYYFNKGSPVGTTHSDVAVQEMPRVSYRDVVRPQLSYVSGVSQPQYGVAMVSQQPRTTYAYTVPQVSSMVAQPLRSTYGVSSQNQRSVETDPNVSSYSMSNVMSNEDMESN